MKQHRAVRYEYKFSKRASVFTYLFATLFTIGGIGLLILVGLYWESFSIGTFLIVLQISLGSLAATVSSVINLHTYKIVITGDLIEMNSYFKNRALAFNNVKGFSLVKGNIIIEPRVEGDRRIEISKYIGNYQSLLKWLRENFYPISQPE